MFFVWQGASVFPVLLLLFTLGSALFDGGHAGLCDFHSCCPAGDLNLNDVILGVIQGQGVPTLPTSLFSPPSALLLPVPSVPVLVSASPAFPAPAPAPAPEPVPSPAPALAPVPAPVSMTVCARFSAAPSSLLSAPPLACLPCGRLLAALSPAPLPLPALAPPFKWGRHGSGGGLVAPVRVKVGTRERVRRCGKREEGADDEGQDDLHPTQQPGGETLVQYKVLPYTTAKQCYRCMRMMRARTIWG